MVFRVYVDTNYAENMLNRRSHTGILINVNSAPIIWFSKQQNKVEASRFESELIDLGVAMEMVEGLRYKHRTFGIPIDVLDEVFCDNQLVVKNLIIPYSTLNNRHISICYNWVREAQVDDIIRVGWIEVIRNSVDLFTKTTISIPTRQGILSKIFNNSAAVIK